MIYIFIFATSLAIFPFHQCLSNMVFCFFFLFCFDVVVLFLKKINYSPE